VSLQTAAIVGLHWGLVHLRGLREAGCQIVALAAQHGDTAAMVAAREGIARGTADVTSLNEVDLVVIATPAATHAGLIRALPGPRLICEKPLLGLTGSPDDLPATDGRMYVNYAFAFLATARDIDGIVAERGAPERIALDVSVHLPLDFTAEQWFLEALSHPLSWLLLRHGPPSLTGRTVAPEAVAVELRAGDVPMRARLQVGGEPGIHQRVAMQWGRDVLLMRGRYRPEQPWSYDPVLLNGLPINGGESSPTDCWLDANAASVRAIVGRFRGDAAPAPLFDARAALRVEEVLLGPVRAAG
jgi:hypothetical protein